MPDNPAADARDLINDRFPEARWALVTGSIMTSQRTSGSDLDIVVRLPDDHPQAPHRESLRWRGRPAELFVHDRATLDHYLTTEVADRKPSLCRMIATGTSLLGEDAELTALQAECAALLAAGPAPLSKAEQDRARYGLTDLLDDFDHSADSGEAKVIAHDLWSSTARLALDVASQWRGTGKWLLRELRACDPELAARWLAAHGDDEATAALAREVLQRAGGPLFEGYHASGTRPLSCRIGRITGFGDVGNILTPETPP